MPTQGKEKMKEKDNYGTNRRETLTWLTLASERSAGKFENSFVQAFGTPLVVSRAHATASMCSFCIDKHANRKLVTFSHKQIPNALD